MHLTFVTDLGQSYVIEVDPQMELENIMALLEADVSTPDIYASREGFHPTDTAPMSRTCA